MTQEEKDLLIKDLCARLPYGVTMNVTEPGEDNVNFNCFLGPDIIKEILSETGHFKYIPYLRPMSSMTEKEFLTLYDMCCIKAFQFRNHPTYYSDFKTKKYVPNFIYSPNQLDYLISRHFDYRGLIPMGLALEAPKGMYK